MIDQCVEVFRRYQLNLATLLCLKKSICKSAIRENRIVIVVSLSKKPFCG